MNGTWGIHERVRRTGGISAGNRDVLPHGELGIGPVAFDLLGPAPISLPGIQRRVQAAATGSRGGRGRDPLPVLLPSICISRVAGVQARVPFLRDPLRLGFALNGRLDVLAVLHASCPVHPTPQMLCRRRAIAKEPCHSEDRAALRAEQEDGKRFYLIAAVGTRRTRGFTKRRVPQPALDNRACNFRLPASCGLVRRRPREACRGAS